MPWVKMYTRMLDDPKLGRVTERVRWRFVQLVLMAGECDAEGYLTAGDNPMSTDDIAWRLRLPADKCAEDLGRLSDIGVLKNSERGWFLPKFAPLQGRSQSEKREGWRRNQAKAREKNRGPDLESADNTDKSAPVIDDTPMTPSPRVEKRREEKSREDLGAAKPPRHPALLAYQRAAKINPDRSQEQAIIQGVGNSPDELFRWEQTVAAYCLQGWNKRNAGNMLEYFRRHEMPAAGKPANGNGRASIANSSAAALDAFVEGKGG